MATTVRVTCRDIQRVAAGPGAGGPPAGIRAAARRVARARRAGGTRAAGRRLSRAADDHDAPARACRNGRAHRGRPARPSPRGAGWPARRVDVPGRGVGDRHRDGAAGGCAGAGAHGDPARGVRAARRGVCASSSRRWARDVAGIGTSTISIEPAAAAARGGAYAARRLHRGGVVGRRGRGHGRRNRRGRRATAGSRAHGRGPRDDGGEHAPRPGRVQSSGRPRSSAARRITTGLWPGFPSDIVSLDHRAGDAGAGPHTAARLDVRTAPVRARAAQLDARRSVSVRSAPHHRHRSHQVARPGAGQPRHPIREWRSSPPRSARKGRARCSKSRRSNAVTPSLVDRLRSLGAQVERRD